MPLYILHLYGNHTLVCFSKNENEAREKFLESYDSGNIIEMISRPESEHIPFYYINVPSNDTVRQTVRQNIQNAEIKECDITKAIHAGWYDC